MVEWYKKKRDEMLKAYQSALEMEEMAEAERLFAEYERYNRAYVDNTQHFGEQL